MATSPRDEALVQLLLGRWKDTVTGLDSAKTYEYTVLLSFPSAEQPNSVEVGEVKSRNVGVVRAAAGCRADSAFSLSGPQRNGLPLLPTLREESDRGAGGAQCVATLCCLRSPRDPKGELPPTHTDILALLSSLPPHPEAEASEKFFKWSLKAPPLVLPGLLFLSSISHSGP